jgi:NitT/TauT family transport system substrate-binding protein
VHVGCFELFGNEGIRRIGDLKGRTVEVGALGSSDHLFVSVMAGHIGSPRNDIHWIASPSATPAVLFAERKIDACIGLPPVPSRASRPQYRPRGRQQRDGPPVVARFCCMLAAGSLLHVPPAPAAESTLELTTIHITKAPASALPLGGRGRVIYLHQHDERLR